MLGVVNIEHSLSAKVNIKQRIKRFTWGKVTTRYFDLLKNC